MTYAELVPPTIPKLRSYASTLTYEHRDDLVQDTLLHALQAWHTFDLSRAVLPWLCTIMRNQFVSSRRTPQRWKVDVEQLPQSIESGAGGIALPQALSALPFDQWEVLVLSEVYEWHDSEIGVALELSKNTVRSRKRYALITLRKLLRCDLPTA